jgi:hypothetical protein
MLTYGIYRSRRYFLMLAISPGVEASTPTNNVAITRVEKGIAVSRPKRWLTRSPAHNASADIAENIRQQINQLPMITGIRIVDTPHLLTMGTTDSAGTTVPSAATIPAAAAPEVVTVPATVAA